MHLRPVPDPKPPARPAARGPRSPSSSAGRRAAVDCVRMLAVAKSGHLDSSLSAADIVAALYYRVAAPRPVEPGVARARPLRALQGPRRADPVRGARPPRLLPARGPDGPAPDRRAAPGPPGHEPHRGRRGLDRLARARASRCASGIALALRLDGLDDTAQVFGLLSDGDIQEGQTWEAATAAPHFGVDQPDRDRRLQPPADRRHHRGGHGHGRRPRQVRGVRLGRGRDRRPRHGRDRRGAGAQPHPRPPGRDRRARPRRAAASPPWRAASASTASRRRPEQAAEALEELDAELEAQTKALHGADA